MLVCSFCGSEMSKTIPVISGMSGAICKSCNEQVFEMFKENMSVNKEDVKGLLKPHEIKEELDKYVIGQEEAKKLLSVAVYNHYKRLNAQTTVDIQKSNILMIGPTGSGKTFLLQTLANIIDVPLVIADATTLTEYGYIGDDVDVIIESLLMKAENNIKKAERGIIYVDEVDKISTLTNTESRAKDAGGRGVQEALLKMIEGNEIQVTIGTNHMNKRKVTINTKNILFVFGGAFVGLEDIIKKRLNKDDKTIGFFTSLQDLNKIDLQNEIIHQDLIDYGFIPEFIGRIPLITSLNPLTKADLSNILTKPKNAIIKQYQELLSMDGVKLHFNEDAIDYIAEQAIARKVGARGLKSIIEKPMYELMYRIPQMEHIQQVTISKEMIMGKSPILPELVSNES